MNFESQILADQENPDEPAARFDCWERKKDLWLNKTLTDREGIEEIFSDAQKLRGRGDPFLRVVLRGGDRC